MISLKRLHGGRFAHKGDNKEVDRGVDRTDRMEFVRAVKDDITLLEHNDLIVSADAYRPLVDIDHFPEIVPLAGKYEVLVEFIIVDRHNFRDVEYAREIGLNVRNFHILPRLKIQCAKK